MRMSSFVGGDVISLVVDVWFFKVLSVVEYLFPLVRCRPLIQCLIRCHGQLLPGICPCLLSLLITFRRHCLWITAMICHLGGVPHQLLLHLFRRCHHRQIAVDHGRVYCAMVSMGRMSLALAAGAAIVMMVIALLYVTFVVEIILPLLLAELLVLT
jgi:hypothetical protein